LTSLQKVVDSVLQRKGALMNEEQFEDYLSGDNWYQPANPKELFN